MGILYAPHSALLDLLDGSIREDALFFTIGIQTLHSAIRKADFFRPVRVVLLDLLVLEFEDLHAVREGGLSSLGLCEEVAGLASFEALLDVVVLEENDLVAIRPDLPLHSVWENYFFLTVIIDSLDFPLLAHILFDQFVSF